MLGIDLAVFLASTSLFRLSSRRDSAVPSKHGESATLCIASLEPSASFRGGLQPMSCVFHLSYSYRKASSQELGSLSLKNTTLDHECIAPRKFLREIFKITRQSPQKYL
jgi:hypothetical protein